MHRNLHTKIFQIKHAENQKNANTIGASTSLQYLTSIISL